MRLAAILSWLDRRQGGFLAALVCGVAAGALGLTWLRVETGVLDWLPQSDPHVVAFRRIFEKLPGAVNQELVWLEIDPVKAARLGVEAVTDAASFIAQEELVRYVRRRAPRVRGDFGVLALVRAADAVVPGGAAVDSGRSDDPSASGLGDSPLRIGVLWRLLEASPAGAYAAAFISQDRKGTILSFIIDAPPLSAVARETGLELSRALDEYRRDTMKSRDLFRDEFLVPVGLSSGTALMDRSLRRDVPLLGALALLLLAITLRATLGSWRSLVVVLGVLALGSVSALGFLGWTGTALNVVTVAIVPLLLGSGVNFAILIACEVAALRAAGLDGGELFAAVGRSSARAVLLTLATTAGGLLVLTASDSPGMAALGLHAASGMALLAVLAIFVVPVFAPRDVPRETGRLGAALGAAAARLARRPVSVLVVWGTATAVLGWAVRTPVVHLDIIEGNFPAGAPVVRSVREMRSRCGGAFPEIVIAHGDLASARALEVLRRIEERVARSPLLGSRFRTFGLPDLLALARAKTWLERGGDAAMPDAVGEAVKGLYADPRWAPLAGLCAAKDLSVGTVLLLGGDAGVRPEEVRTVWRELEEIVAAEVKPDDPVQVSFLGYRTMAHLFAEYSWTWVQRIALVSMGIVVALVAAFVRRGRAVLLVGLLMAGSTIWWLASLELAGVYVSVFLLFPLVFVTSIGSDYGLHLIYGLRELSGGALAGAPSPPEAQRRLWETTGRAVALAAFTDAGVFLVFSRTELVSASQVMLAVALGAAAVFATTLALVPALARGRRP
jgi:predicted RND superfamily exporter protein